jgi:hypothetical protein
MKQEKNELLKDFLNQVESPGFRKEYWQSLETQLDKRNKSRKRLIMVLSIGVCAILAWTLNPHLASKAEFGTNTKKQIQEYGYKSLDPVNTPQAIEQHTTDDISIPRSRKKRGSKTFPYPDKSLPANEVNASQQIITPAILQPSQEPIDELYRLDHMNLPAFGTNHQKRDIDPAILVISHFNVIRKKTPHHRLSLDISLGVINVSRHMQASALADPYYIGRREGEERDRMIASPKISLQYQARNGLIAGLGLEYASYGERINYKPYSMQENIIKQVHYQTDTIPVYNFSTRSTQWETDTNIYVSYDTLMTEKQDPNIGHGHSTNVSYIEVPVYIGYQFSRQSYALSIKAGFSFGKLHARSIRGEYLNGQGTSLVNLSSRQADFSATIASYSLQIRVSKKLAKNIWVFIEPSFKAGLSSVYSTQFVRQKYTSMGSYFGLSFGL